MQFGQQSFDQPTCVRVILATGETTLVVDKISTGTSDTNDCVSIKFQLGKDLVAMFDSKFIHGLIVPA